MAMKITITCIEIDHRKHKIRTHKDKQQDELEIKVMGSYLSKMKEYERQEQELKQRKKQVTLAYMKFWERQIEEKKLLKDLDKLQEKQLKERLNKFNELKQRRVQEEPLTKEAMAYESLTEVNVEQVLKAALHSEQIRVRAETAKREAEDARAKWEDELRVGRNKRMSEHALKIAQAKHSKTKRQLLKEKQEALEKASGLAPRDPTGSKALRPVALPRVKTRTPTILTCTHTKVKPCSRADDSHPSLNMSVYNLHILYSCY